MVSGNDPVESFFNSVELVKNVFAPFESGLKKAAKDLEKCWPGSKNKGRGDVEFNGEVNVMLDERKKKLRQCVVSADKKKQNFLGLFMERHDVHKKEVVERDGVKKDESCVNCLQLAINWSLLFTGFAQAFPTLFKNGKKRSQKLSNGNQECADSKMNKSKTRVFCGIKEKETKGQFVMKFQDEGTENDGKNMSLECCIGFLFDMLVQNLQKFDLGVQEIECCSCDSTPVAPPENKFDHLKAITGMLEGKRVDFSGLLGNLKFARVGGVPSSIVRVNDEEKEETDGGENNGSQEQSEGTPQRMGLLSIPLSNVERLRTTLSTVSLTELIELIPQMAGRASKDHPDKKKLFSVQDFFRYTEAEGRRFFDELDRDGDGKINLEDLEIAMRKRKLPRRYAQDLMRRTRSHLFSKSFGWKQFLSLMEQKEPTILRAYTSLCLSKSGTLQKSEILASLKNAGLPANEDNAVAMMRFLNADAEEFISYGHFRNFLLLLPSDRLQEDPRNIWFEAATVVAVAPPVELPTGNTQVQASTLNFPEVIAKIPQIGVQGLYRGSLPAVLGQFSSHGLRTGIFEASKLVLLKFAPTLPDIQVQSAASFCSTVLGTAVRIPCEVLKQRLQAGIFDNVGEAIVGTWQQDGLKGFFRGTGATLCREVPFYVAGMGLYAESKKAFQQLLGRELEPWETILVGALSGGLAAVATTPFDVMKTRTMTAPQGRPMSMSLVAISILRHEGPIGLFKGAVPRFFWIAPLGAMNFAGYELAKKAMDKSEEQNISNG
uniref:EF-hand domain-containing protein n=1 Tax=Daucus carota subsp. sativus TaxID=79200 RepID=A0A166DSP1_DAUCS